VAPRARVLPPQGQGAVATTTDVAHSTTRSPPRRLRPLGLRRSLSPAIVAAAATTRAPGYARHSADTNVTFVIVIIDLGTALISTRSKAASGDFLGQLKEIPGTGRSCYFLT